MKTATNQPTADQMNANYLDTNTVQFWVNGIMMTAQMSLSDARKMINNGRAFIISSQAIGAVDQNGNRNS